MGVTEMEAVFHRILSSATTGAFMVCIGGVSLTSDSFLIHKLTDATRPKFDLIDNATWPKVCRALKSSPTSRNRVAPQPGFRL